MTYTHCLWDFNGTILDDVDAGISSVNVLLEKRDLPTVQSKEQYREIFGFPIRSYYERLGFDFARESYEDTVAPEWVALYLENVKSSEIYADVPNAICAFQGHGFSQILLSATERRMLEAQVASLKLTDAFDEILGLDHIHAYSKVELARKWRREHVEARVFVVGDTEHDKEVADAIGADCYLIARGHQSKPRLEATGAVVLDSLGELCALLLASDRI